MNLTFVAFTHDVETEIRLLLSTHKNTFDLDITCP